MAATPRLQFSEYSIPPIQIAALAPHHDPGELLVCPVCSCDYVHILAAGTQNDKRLVLAAGDGFHVVDIDRKCRGSSIISVFQCEDGHVFSERREFHKGQTMTTYRAFTGVDLMGVQLWRR